MNPLTPTRRRGSRGRLSPRTMLATLLAALMLPFVFAPPADADGVASLERAAIVREWNEDGTAASGEEEIGSALLLRRDRGMAALAMARGLQPGGVYTFWWVVIQDDGDFPDDIHVQRGGGAVAGPTGRATAFMRAATGTPGIEGFPPLGDAEFAELRDPIGSVVRIEIAYHGQAADAGDDLDLWLSDFWSGAACPPETPNPNPAQPHCPVYHAATFAP